MRGSLSCAMRCPPNDLVQVVFDGGANLSASVTDFAAWTVTRKSGYLPIIFVEKRSSVLRNSTRGTGLHFAVHAIARLMQASMGVPTCHCQLTLRGARSSPRWNDYTAYFWMTRSSAEECVRNTIFSVTKCLAFSKYCKALIRKLIFQVRVSNEHTSSWRNLNCKCVRLLLGRMVSVLESNLFCLVE
ncbi:hypothetical protein SAMN05444149_107144 [Pseudosulfitobacter pseudonitzschiae]|nr:hypothetical protein SAMN05444149_107144 [Pseudosulfitobacter pseudonitzschiae]